jgi:hypothetical protein
MGQKSEAEEAMEEVEGSEMLTGEEAARELLRVCRAVEKELLEGSVQGELKVLEKWLHMLPHFEYQSEDDDTNLLGIGLMYAVANLQRVIDRKSMLS